ncbi:Protein of unknown function [Pyronema omphalodes CBS 100304]|uniref:Uncharacterized protein n=1 Tax=Pyronema omphalodes (strain CBS 100304) TaxID=1076935 RepID=U4KZG7_PYROM|nr:Protein of unknown function [Pyronema omphalodes CBS 100304]
MDFSLFRSNNTESNYLGTVVEEGIYITFAVWGAEEKYRTCQALPSLSILFLRLCWRLRAYGNDHGFCSLESSISDVQIG